MRKRLVITLLTIAVVVVVAYFATQPNDSELDVPTVVVNVAAKSKEKASQPSPNQLIKALSIANEPFLWETAFEEVAVEEVVSEKIAFIIGLNEEATWGQRHTNSNQLKGIISPEDKLALLQFLDSYPNEEDLKAQLSYHSVKTNVLDYLIDRDPDFNPKLMKSLIVKIISDEDQHIVMREYAAQVVKAFYARRWGMIEVGDMPQGWREFETVLWNASYETEDALAGTAIRQLIALQHMSVQHDATAVHDRALEISRDESVSIASRLGAMDVLIKTGKEADYMYLKEVAMSETEDVMIRMKAIHGASEKTNDKEFLFYLKSLGMFREQDQRIATAASLAIQKMKK